MAVVLLLSIFLMLPLAQAAFAKDIPITTSSKEALQLFMNGREKLANLETSQAANLFDQAIQKDPNFALAYLYRSMSGGGFNVSRQNLDKAVSLADKVSPGEKILILYSQAQANNEAQKAKGYIDQLLSTYPEDKWVQETAGLYYYGINDYQNSLTYLNKATSLDNNFASAYNMIGYCQSALGNDGAAEVAFKKYIEIVPDSPNPYDSYAELLLKMGKYDESIAQYQKALQKDPKFVSSLKGIGDNYIFKGDYNTARQYYAQEYDKAPNINQKLAALYWKAVSYVYEGKTDMAIQTLGEQQKLAQDNKLDINVINSYNAQGFILTETGNAAAGLNTFEKASSLIKTASIPEPVKNSLTVSAMLNRSYALAEQNKLSEAGSDADQAKKMIESRKDPVEQQTLNSTLGVLQLKQGDYQKALTYLSESNTDQPINWYYMATAYQKTGNNSKAIEFYNKITTSNDNSLDLALVRNRAMTALKGENLSTRTK